jgi:hypothetical protein
VRWNRLGLILQPGLDTALTALAIEMAAVNADSNIKAELGAAALQRCSRTLCATPGSRSVSCGRRFGRTC